VKRWVYIVEHHHWMLVDISHPLYHISVSQEEMALNGASVSKSIFINRLAIYRATQDAIRETVSGFAKRQIESGLGGTDSAKASHTMRS